MKKVLYILLFILTIVFIYIKRDDITKDIVIKKMESTLKFEEANEYYKPYDYNYVQITDNLYPENKRYNNVGLGFAYCKVNDMTTLETSVVISALQHDYKMVVQYCNQLIAKIYG